MRQLGYLLFPLAALFNSFSMTALLLVFGLAGYAEVAADIALVQGASLALFFAFSANARNVVLAARDDSAQQTASGLMLIRLALLVPLALATYFLSVSVGEAIAGLAITLIVRRVCEWLGEIAMARHEVFGETVVAMRVVVAEGVALTACLAGSLFAGFDLALSALPWAITPLLSLRGARLSLRSQHFGFRAMLPHFGSSGIIGASVFVFRLSVTLLAGKALAGMLFTAFAVGSLVPTVFGQALAPTLIRRFGHGKLPLQFAMAPAGMIIIGSLIAIWSDWFPQVLQWMLQPAVFWLATGLSLVGGGVMSMAMLLRTRLLHEGGGRDIFGPDLLANVLIATGVPFVFYVFGAKSLAWLYLLSALCNVVFLLGVRCRPLVERTRRKLLLAAIPALLVLPFFFQIDGGLFRDAALVFDAQGAIKKLPLPLSVAVMFLGIAVLGNYWQASRTLMILFFSSLLFVLTSLVAANGSAYQEGVKLALLAQFLLPMFGLVLGEMYGSADNRGRFLQWSACGVMLLVLPAQLIASWSNGYTFLSPHVFVFSIYQHLQYFPMVVSALTIATAIALWDKTVVEKCTVLILLPLAAINVFSTHSTAAVLGLLVALAGLGFYHLRSDSGRIQTVLLLVAVVSVLAIFSVAKESGWLANQLAPDGKRVYGQTWQLKLASPSGPKEVAMPDPKEVAMPDPKEIAMPDPKEIAMLGPKEIAMPALNEITLPGPKEIGLPGSAVERFEHWRFFYNGVIASPHAFLAGHAVPPDRQKHPSAHNYWLDTAYNFGTISLVPLVGMLMWTLYAVWKRRRELLKDSTLFGLTLAVLYLLLFENMLKVGMRQPYPGIITFFLWGVLIARLRSDQTDRTDRTDDGDALAAEPKAV